MNDLVLRQLTYDTIEKINQIAMLEDVRQKDVADSLRIIRGHLDNRAADADRNQAYDDRVDLEIMTELDDPSVLGDLL